MSSSFASSSGTPMFGNFSSSTMQSNLTKSPKSSKGSLIENPLLKSAPAFSYGGFGASSNANHQSSSLTTTTLVQQPRSPLIAMTPNRDNLPKGQHQEEQKTKLKQVATPGPPPKMSLSLMGGLAMPMQMKPAVGKEEHIKERMNTATAMDVTPAVPTPMAAASPSYVKKKKEPNIYFAESALTCSTESLVSDHWVVAHGYTSSNEYKELLGILSSFGTIQSKEAGGNWLAVQYESRLAAEKAICSQPFLLSNTLCGITRGTPSLLQSLSSGKGRKLSQSPPQTPAQKNELLSLPHAATTSKSLNEQDILLLENSEYESREPYRPKSVCDKVFAWYFGWEEHPHSD